MRILIITNAIPYPPMSGAPVRTYNILRRFAKNHDVYLAALTWTEDQLNEAPPLLDICRRVVSARPKPQRILSLFWRLIKWPLQGGPAGLRLTYSNELAKGIQNLIAEVDFDIVQIEHGCMGLYLETLPINLRKKAIWILHDIDFEKFRQISRIERNLVRKMRAWIYSNKMKRWQPIYAQQFGLCITMSEADKQLLMTANKRLQIEVSPNGVDTQLYHLMPEEAATPALMFIGNMGYGPNVDAVTYFCREVLPIIRSKISDVEFWIVGINPGDSVKKLSGNGVFIAENVPDVVPFYRQSRVCVVPLRAGSGSRLKILEAMALGRPIVSTSIGAEGLNVMDGKHIVIANVSTEFAEKTIELLRNNELRTKLIAEARKHVVALYDWDIIAERLLSVLEKRVQRTSKE